jgi:hypothetical protein
VNSDKLLKALVADLKEFEKEFKNYVSDVLKNPLNIINIPFMPFNPVAQIINSLSKGTDLTEVYNRLNYIQKEIDDLKNRVVELAKRIEKIPGEVIKILYTNQIIEAIEKYKDTSVNFNTILSTLNLEAATEQCRQDFEDVHSTFSNNLIRQHDYTDHFLNIPFIIGCMNIHISTLSMLGKEPIYIKHFVKKYHQQIEKILNDDSAISLKKYLNNLISIQALNIIQLKSLYTFIFNISSEEGMDEIGKKLNPAEPIDYSLEGVVKKVDYTLLEYYTTEKLNTLKDLIENPNFHISLELLPKKLEKLIVENGTFSFYGTYGLKPANFETTVNLHQFEVLIKPRAHTLWHASNKQRNVDFIYPNENQTLIESYVQKNIVDGENLVNVGIILLDGLKELEKIDEIINTCDELIAMKKII